MKLILLNIAITITCGITLMFYIERHSVHPKYGNYKHFDSKGHSCEPWDSCR